MPVYNERSTVEEAIERALSAPLPVESRQLVVVDDGSTDGTRELLRGRDWPPEVEIVYHERNGGKGAAVRTAIEHARGRWAAILDADLEYDPADIGRLLEPLQAGEAEVVFGVRGFDSRSAFSFWYVVGNKAVTMVANVIFNSWLADIMTCHKAMATDVWRSLDLRARGFELEGEITAPRAGERPARVRGADHLQGARPRGGQEADRHGRAQGDRPRSCACGCGGA